MTSQSALRHIPEETLEQYCMGHLPESETELVEEHLLVCQLCQDALTETEDFLRVVRSATEQMESEPKVEAWWKRWWQNVATLPQPVLALAACALALVVILPNRSADPAVVELQAMRGPESAAQAPANSALSLKLNLSGIDAKEPLELRVADVAGKVIQQAPVQAKTGETVARIDGLAPGTYWARLYSSGQMVQEYALNVK